MFSHRRRAKGLYIAYGCVSGMAVFVCFGLLVDHPAWAKPWLLVLLIIVLLAWILNVVLTAVLRCGRGVGGWTWCSTQPARSATRLATSLPTAPLLASSLLLHCLPRVGNDVCVNLEPKATELLGDSVSLGGAGAHPVHEAAGPCHAVRTHHAVPGSCCVVQVCASGRPGFWSAFQLFCLLPVMPQGGPPPRSWTTTSTAMAAPCWM